MGIDGLFPFLRKEFPKCFSTWSVSFFGKIAIDIFPQLYAFSSTAMRQMALKHASSSGRKQHPSGGKFIVNQEDLFRKIVNRLLVLIVSLRKNGLEPVFVFDGEGHNKKQDTRNERKKIKENSKEKMSEINSKEDPKGFASLAARTASVSQDHLLRIWNILIDLGIPCIRAKNDAEELCAALVRDGFCEAAYTTDSDILAYGCPNAIFEIKGDEAKVVVLDSLLKKLDFSMKQFVDFCILCGTDFNKKVPNFAAKKSFNLIRDMGSISNIRKDPPNKWSSDNLDYKNVRKIFAEKKTEEITCGKTHSGGIPSLDRKKTENLTTALDFLSHAFRYDICTALNIDNDPNGNDMIPDDILDEIPFEDDD